MLKISDRAPAAGDVQRYLELSFAMRCRSRQRVVLDNGEEAALVLPRGLVLRGGDRLLAEDGRVIGVRAASELVSTAGSADFLVLARAAYHLGNRHVALQITPHWLRYLHDHVLDAMVVAMGLVVEVGQAPFEPEAGAYAPGAAHDAHPPHAHGRGDLA